MVFSQPHSFSVIIFTKNEKTFKPSPKPYTFLSKSSTKMSNIPEEPTKEKASKSSMCPETPAEEVIKEIPEETIKEIMVLLPVKSLLKFRSVQHSWLSFIDSPYCVKAHFSKSTPKLILNAPQGLFALDIKTEPKLETLALKDFPPSSRITLWGSSNGVLLSHHTRTPILFEDLSNVALQNPHTRTFHKLPFSDPKWPGPEDMYTLPERYIFGLWYDELTDDYKVLRICQYGSIPGKPFLSQVDLCSLKMQSHKELISCPYYIRHAGETILVGGALHWVVSSAEGDKSQWIGSFDVVTEVYGLLEQPANSSGDCVLFLLVLGGCLSVVCSYTLLGHKEVWVMKEYGNVESWCKILSITGADIGVESFGYLKPLLYSECGKRVLIQTDFEALLWYDLEKKSAEFVELDKDLVSGHFQTFLHVASLVKLSCSMDKKSIAPGNDEEPNKRKKKRDDFLSKGFKLKL